MLTSYRCPNSQILGLVGACAMDLGNREWYHRSAGVKTTQKNSEIKNLTKEITKITIKNLTITKISTTKYTKIF